MASRLWIAERGRASGRARRVFDEKGERKSAKGV
jgi:hypothetical protein